jgi:hypothetical protein
MAKQKALSEAAKQMAAKSVRVRKRAWGDEGFRQRMQEYGRLGGRPKGSTKKLEPK